MQLHTNRTTNIATQFASIKYYISRYIKVTQVRAELGRLPNIPYSAVFRVGHTAILYLHLPPQDTNKALEIGFTVHHPSPKINKWEHIYLLLIPFIHDHF